MDFGFTAIPAITIICYLVSELFKIVVTKLLDAEESKRVIPVLCGVVGASLGVFCYVLYPGFIPAENSFVAAVIGIVSGWAATGANQIVKQLGQ